MKYSKARPTIPTACTLNAHDGQTLVVACNVMFNYEADWIGFLWFWDAMFPFYSFS